MEPEDFEDVDAERSFDLFKGDDSFSLPISCEVESALERLDAFASHREVDAQISRALDTLIDDEVFDMLMFEVP